MLIKISDVVKDMETGKNVKDPASENQKDLTFGVVFRRSLWADQTVQGVEGKEKTHVLALKIHKAIEAGKDVVDLTSDEITKIKASVANTFSTMVLGMASHILENPVTPAPTAGEVNTSA